MGTVKEHYGNVLAEVYSWMYGGFENGIQNFTAFFDAHKITPSSSGVAIDLGAGCGFQTIPLARRGFSVVAIDTDATLLEELKAHVDSLDIKIIQDDLMHFERHCTDKAELVVCITDTILHLDCEKHVSDLFVKVYNALEERGNFILSFRDLSHDLHELDRFIPVKSDNYRIMTCFLEYEPKTVKVHDILYEKRKGGWELKKSFYRKLRLSKSAVIEYLSDAGFDHITINEAHGMITVVARNR